MSSFNEYVSWLWIASELEVSDKVPKLDKILTFDHFDSSGNGVSPCSFVCVSLLQTCPESAIVHADRDQQRERVEPDGHVQDANHLVDCEEDLVVRVSVPEADVYLGRPSEFWQFCFFWLFRIEFLLEFLRFGLYRFLSALLHPVEDDAVS